MSANLSFFFAFAGGLGLGLFYFGGLWLTVKRLPGTPRPALLMLGSFLGRLAVVILGFYLLLDGQWTRLVVGLSGFMVVRFMLLRRLRPESTGPGVRNVLR